MLAEKNITLLTPAVLNCTALEYLKDQSPSFHRKHILRFAFMQGIWFCILYILCVATIVFPLVTSLRETSSKVLLNANFTQCEIKNGQLISDIKPMIWSFSLSDTDTAKQEVVIASTKAMNRFYWDDRVEKGMVKKINGVSFMPDYVYYKQGTDIKKIYYSQVFGNRGFKMTKSQLFDYVQKVTDKKQLTKITLLLLPLVLLLGMIVGCLSHGVYMLVVGFILGLFTKNFVKNPSTSYKIASGLYVGWAYIIVLSLIAQRILLWTNINLSAFFLMVNTVGFVSIIGVGYLCLRTMEQDQLGISISKLKKRER